MSILLSFINDTKHQVPFKIAFVLHQKASSSTSFLLRWQTLEFSKPGERVKVHLSTELALRGRDSFGTSTNDLEVFYGELVTIVDGPKLQMAGFESTSTDIQIRNGLPTGSASFDLLQNGRRVASIDNVAPNSISEFKVDPVLWLGEVVETDATDHDAAPPTVAEIDTSIELTAMLSANIVVSDNTDSNSDNRLSFALDNIKRR